MEVFCFLSLVKAFFSGIIINTMNELIFLLHIIIVIGFLFIALHFGKNALMGLVCLQVILANLFVVKQINIFGLNATGGDVFIVGSVLGMNLLQEYFGKKIADKTLIISFLNMIFYLTMSFIHLLYVPNSFDTTNNFFYGILKFAPRITIASIFSYLIVLKLNNWLYLYLKKICSNKYIVLRSFISLVLSQLLDTFLFAFLALYGIVGSIWQIILVSFTLKIIVAIIATPFLGFTRIILRR